MADTVADITEPWVETLRMWARRYAYGGAETHRMYVTMPTEARQNLKMVSKITGIPMGTIIRLAVEDLLNKVKEPHDRYWCSHAVSVDGDEVLCGNSPGEPQKVSKEECQSCSVGMVRRLRDGW